MTWRHQKENHYKFLGEGKETKKMKNNELIRSEDEDVQLEEDLFIEADSSSDYDSDNEHEDR